MSTSELLKELFKIATALLILLLPIICFGQIILFEEDINNRNYNYSLHLDTNHFS